MGSEEPVPPYKVLGVLPGVSGARQWRRGDRMLLVHFEPRWSIEGLDAIWVATSACEAVGAILFPKVTVMSSRLAFTIFLRENQCEGFSHELAKLATTNRGLKCYKD